MIERLKMIYYKTINTFKLFKKGKKISNSNSHKKAINSKINNEKESFKEISGNNNFKGNETEFNNGKKMKNIPPTINNANIKLNLNLIKYMTNKNRKLNINKISDIDYKISKKSVKKGNANKSIEFDNELIKIQSKEYNTLKTEPCLINKKFDYNNQITQKNDDEIEVKEEKEKKDKIYQLMKVKRISISAKNKFVLKSSKELDRISNKHKTKKLIDLYSPLNKMIDKEYSNLFNWIEGSINKTPIKYNTRSNSEEKIVDLYKIKNKNNKRINKFIKRDFSSKSTPKKLNFNKNLKISDFKSKFNEKSYKIIMNDSLYQEKKKDKALTVDQKKFTNNRILIRKKYTFKNDLDSREKTLKRLFSKYLKTESYFMKSPTINKKKQSTKKNLHFNIISNIQQYNNLSSLAYQRANFFLCSENTKKKYGLESPTIFINNNILSYYFQNSLNSNEYFK